jgi:hypothetical protein
MSYMRVSARVRSVSAERGGVEPHAFGAHRFQAGTSPQAGSLSRLFMDEEEERRGIEPHTVVPTVFETVPAPGWISLRGVPPSERKAKHSSGQHA